MPNIPTATTRERHSFGGNAATRAQQRATRAAGRESYIKNFREDRTDVRCLFEDPKLTWHEYWQHYDKNLKISYPCGREVFGTCIGCRQPVTNEDADAEEKRKDHGWTVRKAGQRFVVPMLNSSDYVDLYSVSKTFRDEVASTFEAVGTITAQDAIISKIKNDNGDGTGELRNKYVFNLVGAATERKLTRELRELYQQCAAGLAATPLSEEQEAANMRWVNGYLALGIPNIGEALGDKYVHALEKYGTNLEAEEALAAQIAADREANGNPITNLKAQAAANTPAATAVHTGQSAPATPPAEPPAPRDYYPADAARLSEDAQVAELRKVLTDWQVPFPADAELEQLKVMYNAFAPSHAPTRDEARELQAMTDALTGWGIAIPPGAGEPEIRMLYNAFAPTRQAAAPVADEPQADPTAAMIADLQDWGVVIPDDADETVIRYLWEAAHPTNTDGEAAASTPPPAAAAAPPTAAAQAEAGMPLTADGTPNFRAMKTELITAWLDNGLQESGGNPRFNYDPNASRSEIIAIAEQAAIPF